MNYISPEALILSPLWNDGHAPALRTVYNWTHKAVIPSNRINSRIWLNPEAVRNAMRELYWHWPTNIKCPGSLRSPSNCNQLAGLSGIASMGIWQTPFAPCRRTINRMIANGLIPYYSIGRRIFIQRDEVVYCLVTHTEVMAKSA